MSIGSCFICKSPLADGHHYHPWRRIPEWDVTICQTCVSGNWDGLPTNRYPHVLEHLKAIGFKGEYNAKGFLIIPGVTILK